MKILKTAAAICCMAFIGAVIAPVAQADAWNRKTVITFSAPVSIPGVHLAGWGVLPAGTYVFKVMDSQSNRHIVQIFNQEETTIYATILAIPNYRLKATDKTVVTFRERAAGEPEALRAWFYPGRNYGEEFVYPKALAMEIAKATNTDVLYTTEEHPVEVTEAIKEVDAPVVAQMTQRPIMAAKPSGEAALEADAVTPPPVETAAVEVAQAAPPTPAPVINNTPASDTSAAVEQTLPSTAGNVPLIGLLGLMALGGTFAVSALRKRSM